MRVSQDSKIHPEPNTNIFYHEPPQTVSDKYNGAYVLVKRSAEHDHIVTGFMVLNLVSFFPASPHICNQGSCMVPNMIPADSPEKPHYIRIITKYDDSNILNISAQEIPWPEDPIFKPGVVPVAPESVDKYQAGTIIN